MKTRTTRAIVSGKSALYEIPGILSREWPNRTALIIADESTWFAAGRSVSRLILESGGRAHPEYVISGTRRLHADTDRIVEVRALLERYPDAVPVAVGSGTLNDIVKRASFECGLSYVCVPTAPSVDGYTSFGAAITVHGFKTTLPCDAPVAIVADEDIMAAAPYELLAAGYGDLAAKLASGRDWLIARELGFESIDPGIWALSQNRLVERLSSPDKLAAREPSAVRAVFDGLCDTGLAMQDQGDSRPASGAEHHISHCWEMRGLTVNDADVLHGEKVAAGTLLSTAISEQVFSFSVEDITRFAFQSKEISPAGREREVRALYARTGVSESAVSDIVRVSLEKLATGSRRAERLSLIIDRWNAMREFAFKDRPSSTQLQKMLTAAGCPEFRTIGIDRAFASWGIAAAQTIRNRYTVFDLAYDLGILPEMINLVITKI